MKYLLLLLLLVCADSDTDEKYFKYVSFTLSLFLCIFYWNLVYRIRPFNSSFFLILKCKNRTENLKVFFHFFFLKTNWKGQAPILVKDTGTLERSWFRNFSVSIYFDVIFILFSFVFRVLRVVICDWMYIKNVKE